MRIYRVRINVSKYYDAVFDFESSVAAASCIATLAKRLNQDEAIGAEQTKIYLEVAEPEPQEAEDGSEQ